MISRTVLMVILSVMVMGCNSIATPTELIPYEDNNVPVNVAPSKAPSPKPTEPLTIPTNMSKPTVLPTRTPISQPTPGSEPLPPSMISGVYFGNGNVNFVKPSGEVEMIYDRPIDILSPDNNFALTNIDGKYWMVKLADGSIVKLTMNPDRDECCAQWWIGHEDRIILISSPRDGSVPVALNGYLSVIKTNGTGFRVLDNEHPTQGIPAISADGTWMAYGSGEIGWLFGGELGPRQVNPQEFGLVTIPGQRIMNPSWSPDGKKLAWRYIIPENTTFQEGFLVLDLVTMTHSLTPLSETQNPQRLNIAPVWSPDGKWLVYQVQSNDASKSGVWVWETENPESSPIKITDGNLVFGEWSSG